MATPSTPRARRRVTRVALVAGACAFVASALLANPALASSSRPRGVDIRVIEAAGVEQWLHCRGSGPVTVVVISGLHSSVSDWSRVSWPLAKITRTCFYDRPGLGHSPARPDPNQILNAGLYADELTALLKAAHEPGPYVVIGHSFGGLVARAFVRKHLGSVSGVLLAESVDPGDKTLGKYWSEAGHQIDMVASTRAAGDGPRIGSRPLLVLSASRPDEDHLKGPLYGLPEWMIQQWRDEQHEDVHLSRNSMQVIARSGHVLQQDNPQAVIAAVRTLVVAVERHSWLTCSYDWSRVHAVCRD